MGKEPEPPSCAPAGPTLPPGPAPSSTVEVPITINEMLLRGCMLKNSGFVTGLVVYTGRETRIQMNAAKTPLKVGALAGSRSSWAGGWAGRAAGGRAVVLARG